jgi:hypothetical protein
MAQGYDRESLGYLPHAQLTRSPAQGESSEQEGRDYGAVHGCSADGPGCQNVYRGMQQRRCQDYCRVLPAECGALFPPGRAKWLGAVAISSNFEKVVQEHGFHWSVDQLLSDVDRYAATMEWTRINRQRDRLVRGVDWFVFEPQTFSIQEIRCYYAAPLHSDMQCQELVDFDYAARGYPTT